MQESKRNFFGSHISECCREIIKEAEYYNTEIFIEFNGVKLIATKDSTEQKLVDYFNEEMNKREKEYKSSEEYQAKSLMDQSEILENQIILDNEIENLKTLDFNNYEMVLDWFCKIQDVTDRVGVKFDKKSVIQIFENNGYFIGVNTGDNFNENDEGNFARYIVGQCLGFLDTVGAIHHVVHRFTQQWKQKFK